MSWNEYTINLKIQNTMKANEGLKFIRSHVKLGETFDILYPDLEWAINNNNNNR